MIFLLIIIGLVLIVTAYHSTMGDLATALETDLPGFFKWALAIAAILALGYVPALRTPSRWLLALVALVILLKNWQQISQGLQGFQSAAGADPQGQATPQPTTAYATTGAPAAPPTIASITGTSSGGASSGGASSSTAGAAAAGAAGAAAAALPGAAALSPAAALAGFNPSAFLQSFSQSIGFGGLAS